jgi:hypothetical protein
VSGVHVTILLFESMYTPVAALRATRTFVAQVPAQGAGRP